MMKEQLKSIYISSIIKILYMHIFFSYEYTNIYTIMYHEYKKKKNSVLVNTSVRKNMDVKEHEKLSNFTLRHKLK